MLILVGESVFEKHACFIEVVAVGVVNASISSAYPIHGCLTISAMPDNVWDSADMRRLRRQVHHERSGSPRR
jgi:hypothetical protein